MKVSMPAYPIDLCDARKEATAAQAHELIREAKTVQQELAHSNILTSNSEMRRIVRIAQQVANADVPVLMLGESGVGKDVFALFIHNESNRFGNPFVKVNCAACRTNCWSLNSSDTTKVLLPALFSTDP